jgi:hypothetical protein
MIFDRIAKITQNSRQQPSSIVDTYLGNLDREIIASSNGTYFGLTLPSPAYLNEYWRPAQSSEYNKIRNLWSDRHVLYTHETNGSSIVTPWFPLFDIKTHEYRLARIESSTPSDVLPYTNRGFKLYFRRDDYTTQGIWASNTFTGSAFEYVDLYLGAGIDFNPYTDKHCLRLSIIIRPCTRYNEVVSRALRYNGASCLPIVESYSGSATLGISDLPDSIITPYGHSLYSDSETQTPEFVSYFIEMNPEDEPSYGYSYRTEFTAKTESVLYNVDI